MAAQPAGGSWWTLDGNAQRSAVSPAPGPSTGALAWSFDLENPLLASPAVGADGSVYVTCEDGRLVAVSPEGQERWTFQAGERIWSPPSIGCFGDVYFGCWDNKVYAVNYSGQLRWTVEIGGSISSAAAIGADGTVYIVSDDGYLWALGKDGSVKWRYFVGQWSQYVGGLEASPTLGPDGTIYVGGSTGDPEFFYANGGGMVLALSPQGELLWQFPVHYSWITSHPVVAGDGFIYASSGEYCYALRSDGTLAWQRCLTDLSDSNPASSHIISGPVLTPEGVLVFTCDYSYFWDLFPPPPDGFSQITGGIGHNGCLVALNRDTGALAWYFSGGSDDTAEPPGFLGTPVLDSQGILYVCTWANYQVEFGEDYPDNPDDYAVVRDDSKLYALDCRTGQPTWETTLAGGVSNTPALAPSSLYVCCDDGKLYKFK